MYVYKVEVLEEVGVFLESSEGRRARGVLNTCTRIGWWVSSDKAPHSIGQRSLATVERKREAGGRGRPMGKSGWAQLEVRGGARTQTSVSKVHVGGLTF